MHGLLGGYSNAGGREHGCERAAHRLDRRRPHGAAHGRAAAQGRPRRHDLEPHRAPRPSRCAKPAARSSRAPPTSPASTSCSRSSRPARTWRRSISAPDGVASGNGKLPAVFVDCSTIARRGIRRDPAQAPDSGSAPITSPRPVSGNAKVIKRRQALRRRLRARGRLPPGRAADRGVRAAAASPTSARASSRASARSPTTSCWAS